MYAGSLTDVRGKFDGCTRAICGGDLWWRYVVAICGGDLWRRFMAAIYAHIGGRMAGGGVSVGGVGYRGAMLDIGGRCWDSQTYDPIGQVCEREISSVLQNSEVSR
jgi:hypothetical protein